MVEGGPKIRAGTRTLAMPAGLVALLRAHLETRGLAEDDIETHLFTGKCGVALHCSNWRRRVWKPACAAARIKDFQFRDLRHVNATSMALAGVDMKTAQVRLGHSSPQVTLAIYTQVTSESDRRAADAMGGHFFPVAKNRPKFPLRRSAGPPQTAFNPLSNRWALRDSNPRPQPCEGLDQVFICPSCGAEIWLDQGIE